MVLKIAIPGKMQFKMMRREPYLLHRKGDVHYIGGAEVLPPPLPSEQENQVIGDLGTEYEDEAKAILIEHNLRLVVYIAKKFDNTGVGVEDLISIGTIGLMKAVDTFDATRKARFSTYASRCIENAILSPAHFGMEKRIHLFHAMTHLRQNGFFGAERAVSFFCFRGCHVRVVV